MSLFPNSDLNWDKLPLTYHRNIENVELSFNYLEQWGYYEYVRDNCSSIRFQFASQTFFHFI